MAKNFRELRGKMSAGAREASDAEYRRLVEEMPLHQLRKARELTQTKIAEELHMGRGMCRNLSGERICMSAHSPATCKPLAPI